MRQEIKMMKSLEGLDEKYNPFYSEATFKDFVKRIEKLKIEE